MFGLIKQGIGYVLEWAYNLTDSYGWALILFTLARKLLLLPLGLKQQKSMTKMQIIQPKLEIIKEKYKNDQQMQSQEMMKLYKEYNISPMGGCLPLLIQLPILFMLYRVIQEPLTYMLHMSAEEIKAVASGAGIGSIKGNLQQIKIANAANLINFRWAGIDLSVNPTADGYLKPAMLIPVLAALTTYLSSKISTLMNKNKKEEKKEEEKPKRILSPEQKTGDKPAAADMGKTMTMVMPIITLFITTSFPAAMGVYWIASNVFSTMQTVVLNGYYAKKTSAEIEAHSAELEEKKQKRIHRKKKRGNNQ